MNKKLLLSLALTAGILTSAIAGRTYCLTNSYGEQATLKIVSKVGGGVYNIQGSYNYQPFGGTIWPVTGTYNKRTGELHFVATNPDPDFCTNWANTVTFDYVGSGLSFTGSFSNDCGLAGALTATAVAGSCGFLPVTVKQGEYGTTGSHKMLRSQLPLPAGIDFKKSLSFNTISVSPNPVVREAQINVTLDFSAKVTLNIYNQNGTLVRTITNGIASEGPHNYKWNLQTQNGTRVKTGFYTVKLVTDDGEESTRIFVAE
jgi:hypothetical protein